MGFIWDPNDPDTSLEVEKFPVFNRTSLSWCSSFPLEVGSFFPLGMEQRSLSFSTKIVIFHQHFPVT